MSTVSTNLGMILAQGSDIVNVVSHVANNFQILDNTFAANTPTTQAIGDAATQGSAVVVSRSDHKHGMPAFGTPVATGTAISNGVSANIARADHVHTLNFGAAVALDGTLADGTSLAAARADHKHSLPANPTFTTPTVSNIQFPATQVASANANNLDDYEEGTWTPAIGGTATYTTQSGFYFKIGKFVFLGFYIKINLKGTGSATDMTGIPFPAVGGAGSISPAGVIEYWASTAVNLLAASCVISLGGQAIRVTGATAATAASTNNFGVFGNSAEIEGSIWYAT